VVYTRSESFYINRRRGRCAPIAKRGEFVEQRARPIGSDHFANATDSTAGAGSPGFELEQHRWFGTGFESEQHCKQRACKDASVEHAIVDLCFEYQRHSHAIADLQCQRPSAAFGDHELD